MTRSQRNLNPRDYTLTHGPLESLVQMNLNGFYQNKAFLTKDTDTLTKVF